MRTIDKQSEPSCLAELRREARRTGADTGRAPVGNAWNPGACGESIRRSLHDEQGGLCAYCMGRIKPHGYRSNLHELGGMKIEHWDDRSTHPERMYDWDNLLGVCGGEYRGPDGLVEHCDTSRGSKRLHVNPGTRSPPRPEDVFVFKSTPFKPEPERPDHPQQSVVRQGVWIHPCDPMSARDPKSPEAHDIKTLNLNAAHLVKNRHAALEELRLALRKHGSLGEQELRRLLRRWFITATKPGPRGLPLFAPLIADYIRKKLRAKGMSPSA